MAAKRPTAVWVSPGDRRQNRRINYDCSFIFILHFLFHRLALLCSIFIYRYFPLPASDSVQGSVRSQYSWTLQNIYSMQPERWNTWWKVRRVFMLQVFWQQVRSVTPGPIRSLLINIYPLLSICPHIFSFIFITSSSCLVSSISLLLPPSCPPIGSDSSSPPRPESCFFFFSSALWSSGHTLFCAALLLPVR